MKGYKIIIPKQILILTGLAAWFNIVRIVWSDSIYFLYLLWNIFLAYLPFFVSFLLLRYQENKQNETKSIFFILGGAIWLFLFPNAPYLVTDMIHLSNKSLVPMWYDALVLFSTAWVGVLLTIYSLSHIEQLLLEKYSKKIASCVFYLLILVSSFGIYIGRFLRWNSWDVVIQPKNILEDVFVVLSRPFQHSEPYIFTFYFFVFILFSYRAWVYSKNSI